MNFIITLSENESYLNIIIITDKLSKNVSLTILLNLEIETVIQNFIKNVFLLYEASLTIILN